MSPSESARAALEPPRRKAPAALWIPLLIWFVLGATVLQRALSEAPVPAEPRIATE